jgi:DNA-binding response OmpR family regulator
MYNNKTKYYVQNEVKTYEIADDLTAPEPKRVLILEDEAALSSVLKDFLEENKFVVTVVTSGADGLQKIMQTEYDAILCDMVMPNFPGDMFYLAVERVRPQMCRRFIFMTGHLGDPQIDAFIRRVRGLMLWKPFQLHEVLEAIKTVFKKTATEGSRGTAA